jgi:hypothetical protein
LFLDEQNLDRHSKRLSNAQVFSQFPRLILQDFAI